MNAWICVSFTWIYNIFQSTSHNVGSFVYMSPIHIYQDLPSEEGPLIKEQVYDLAGLGDPNEFLQSLLGADEKGK